MPNLNISELMNAIIRIRDNIDKVEVKGHVNRSLLLFAYEDCNSLLKQLGNIYDELQKAKDSNAVKEQIKPELKEVPLNDTDENT